MAQDMRTEDGLPANLKEKSDAFVASAAFENMVQCFAAEIAKASLQNSAIPRYLTKGGFGIRPEWDNASRAINIYVTTDCAQIRAEFAERIKHAVIARLDANYMKVKRQQNISSAYSNDGIHERRLAVPLAFSDWKVAVDYFNGNLSAAHFFVWTMPNNEMKEVRARNII